ncbi:MAG: pyridoxal phosphate-dependent decarboxylase family protein [Candidatus Promineifilaceae bacterium]
MAETPELGEMNLDDFRQYGHEIVDWIADYLARPEQYPVLSRVRPGEIAARLPLRPPEEGEPMVDILADFEKIILPGITHWNHPGFHAYFSVSGSAPGILGEMLIAALNVNAMLWRTSPSATELEEVSLEWLRTMLGMDEGWHGVITDGASASSLLAIAAAREALDLDIHQKGMAGRSDLPRLRLYISDQTHSSVEKGAITLGIGQEGVRTIPTDDDFRLDPQALAQAIEEDLAAGWRPFFVTATVGTTATTSVDPVPEMAAICRQYGLWLHVDGAYGGAAAVAPEMRHVLDGLELADSFVMNPHKWLFTPIDCSAFYVRRPEILQQAFSLVPEYLKTAEEGVTNYMDWGVQLGRRFRALKLWMVIRAFGRQGIAARLREHICLGQQLAAWIDAAPDFERLAPTPFSVVCFRLAPREIAARLALAGPEEARALEEELDRLNMALVEAMNDTGQVFLAPTRLRGRLTIRLAIGNIRTDEAHVRRVWALLEEKAERLTAAG